MSDIDSGADPDMPPLVNPEVLQGAVRGCPILLSGGVVNTEQDFQAYTYNDEMGRDPSTNMSPPENRDIDRRRAGSLASKSTII